MNRHGAVIIGSGPTAAGAVRSLVSAGYTDVVVLEREQEAGGVPRHCGHTGYGLREFGRLMSGPAYARRLAELEAEVYLRRGHTVRALKPGGVLEVTGPDGPYEIAGRTVLLAMGARETPRSARLTGGIRGHGVFTTGALQQWVYLEQRRPATKVVVVGTELVSFSTLLTCRHAGIEILALVDDARQVTARWPAGPVTERLFGVPVRLGTHLVRILGSDRVEGVVLEQDGKQETLACDGVVFTGKFVPESALLAGSPVERDPGSGGPVIDQYGRCSDPVYFAAGNLVHPIETAGQCFRDGIAAGKAIAAALARTLPPPAPARRIRATGALKYLYPQRLSGTGAVPLGGRVTAETTGTLTIRLDGSAVWSRRVHLLPERRIRIPAGPFARPFDEAEVTLA
jgi:thioredoxin reductase